MTSAIPCDICGSTEVRLLFDRGRGGEPLSNVICQRCGMVFVSPRPDAHDVRDRYCEGVFSLDARGSRYPTVAKIRGSERAARRRYHILSKHVGVHGRHPGHCLEIGCGLGSFLAIMHRSGWRTIGLEPDEVYAAFGSAMYGTPIEPTLYEDRVFSEGSFDLIASFHVIEHVVSPRRFLAKAYRELTDDGYLFLEHPCIERPYAGNLEKFFWAPHLSSFSNRTLNGLLRDVGFDRVAFGYSCDFLWTVARKSASRAARVLQFPLDDPAEVYELTHSAHREFIQREQSVLGRVQDRIRPLAEIVLTKWRQDRWGLALNAVNILVSRPVRRLARTVWPAFGRKYISHFGLHDPGNAGDTALFVVTRRLLNLTGPHPWSLEPLRQEVTAATVERINAEAKAVVIGGGGVFLRDSNPNQISGWQWPCPIDLLRAIRVPIIVFAVGYNRFRQQAEFDQVFQENVAELVRRAAFFALRNRGSIAALAGYLDSESASRLMYQPCPTTLAARLYPRLTRRSYNHGGPVLALNAAFDRAELRFTGRENEILSGIAKAMRHAERQGWKIVLVLHLPDDAMIVPWLEREGVRYATVNLCERAVRTVIRFYASVDLAVGMRGHAQMIPFGVGTPIISVISHDKLAWFLADIGHPEWGIDAQDPALENLLRARIEDVRQDIRGFRSLIADAQESLWQISQQNLATIAGLFQ